MAEQTQTSRRRPYRRLLEKTEPVPPEDASVRMTLRIAAAQYEQIRTVSHTTSRPITDIVRAALTQYLSDILPS